MSLVARILSVSHVSLDLQASSKKRLFEQAYQQQVAPAPPAAPAPPEGQQDVIEQLKQLGELHTSGVLTDEEFAAQKAKLLGN